MRSFTLLALALAACSHVGSGKVDAAAGETDAAAEAPPADGGPPDAVGIGADCEVGGAPGECLDTGDCAALGDHTSVPGYCPGPAEVQCCIAGPSPTDNPPPPDGWRLMMQADVTPEMTEWAIEILNDPATYPMFSTTTREFGALTVLARVEWHPPNFHVDHVHRGVTLYEPI